VQNIDSLFVHCLRLCFWGSIPANQNAQLSKRFWITTSSAVLDRHTAEGCNFTVPENCILKWLEWSTWQLITERNFLQTINGTVHQPAQSHEVFAMSHPHHFQGALRFLSWWSSAGRAIRPALGICVAWHGCRAYCMQPKGTQFEHRKHQPIMIWDDPFLRRSEMCIRFFGEEISMSARLWTSGWDFFHPTSEFFGGTFCIEWCNSCWVILLVKCGKGSTNWVKTHACQNQNFPTSQGQSNNILWNVLDVLEFELKPEDSLPLSQSSTQILVSRGAKYTWAAASREARQIQWLCCKILFFVALFFSHCFLQFRLQDIDTTMFHYLKQVQLVSVSLQESAVCWVHRGQIIICHPRNLTVWVRSAPLRSTKVGGLAGIGLVMAYCTFFQGNVLQGWHTCQGEHEGARLLMSCFLCSPRRSMLRF